MIARSKFLTVYALLAITALYLNLHSDIAVPTNRPFSEFPVENRGWRMVSQSEFSDNVLSVLKPTDYLYRQYTGPDGANVSLYMGFHGGGKGSGGIHSPKHCLPGSGWYEVSSSNTSVDLPGGKVGLVRAVYQKGESSELFLYWFQVKGRALTDEYSLKLAEITNSVRYRRKDSAFIRVSVPFGADEKKAMGTAVRFLLDFYPVIQEFLPS
jgi:EpsI family protein